MLPLERLLKDKLAGMAGLDAYMSADPFAKAENQDMPCVIRSLSPGEGLVVPFGHVPIVWGYNSEGAANTHCLATIFSLATNQCTSGADASTKACVKAYMDQELVKYATVKCWERSKDPLQQWIAKW